MVMRDARSVERVEPCGTEPSGARHPRGGERVARKARRAQDHVAQVHEFQQTGLMIDQHEANLEWKWK